MSRVVHPGSGGQKVTGSRIRIRNTAGKWTERTSSDLFGLVQEGLVLEDEDPARLLQGAQVGVQQPKLAGSLLLHFKAF